MTINFDLKFNVNTSVFVASAPDSNLSFHHADGFINFAFGSITSGITPDDVEAYVTKSVAEYDRVRVAEALMNNLLACHNVSIFN